MTQEEMKRIIVEYIDTVSKKSSNKHSFEALKNVTIDYLNKFIEVKVISSIPLLDEQEEALYMLHDFCAYQALYDFEVQRDIRKLSYVANMLMKKALVAIGLSASMVTPQRRNNETKEFFENNILIISNPDGSKSINFGSVPHERFQQYFNYDIVRDWRVYSDARGFGIKSLVDYKTGLGDVKDFLKGGDFIIEFARFQRKYQEQVNKKTTVAKESAQEAFRNSMVSSIANKFTEQQILEGKTIEDMMLLVEGLFVDNNQQGANKPNNNPQPNVKRITAKN